MRCATHPVRMLPLVLLLVLPLAPAPAAAQPAGHASAAAPADAWPQFRGTPALSGVSEAELPAELTLKWTYQADDIIDSSAAIADGTVYVGSYSGNLIALDLDTGEERWKYSTGNMGIGESSPAVAGGLVFIGDLGGVFHAVDAATGKARWTFETLGEIKSSPVVVGDRVLIGSYDGFLYALDVADGALVWAVRDAQLRARDPRRLGRRGLLRRLRRGIPRGARQRRGRDGQPAGGRLHHLFARDRRRAGLLRDLRQRGHRHRPRDASR